MKPERKMVSWRPSGPVALMLNMECRGRAHGAVSRVVERSVAQALGPKYPKLLAKWRQLRDDVSPVNGNGKRHAHLVDVKGGPPT